MGRLSPVQMVFDLKFEGGRGVHVISPCRGASGGLFSNGPFGRFGRVFGICRGKCKAQNCPVAAIGVRGCAEVGAAGADAVAGRRRDFACTVAHHLAGRHPSREHRHDEPVCIRAAAPVDLMVGMSLLICFDSGPFRIICSPRNLESEEGKAENQIYFQTSTSL